MKLTIFITFCLFAQSVYAGNVRVLSNRTHNSCVQVQQVQQVYSVPVNVQFVPSQVLLNGQVTTYGTAQQVTYAVSNPLVSNPGEVDPNPVAVQSVATDIEKRMERLEAMVEELIKASQNKE